MAKRKSRPRRRASFKLLNALESLTYAEILSRGIAGTGIAGLITGKGDIAESFDSTGMMTGYTGTGAISLSDIDKMYSPDAPPFLGVILNGP